MAADSDGCNTITVVTCKGDLSDPSFPGQFEKVLDKLRGLLGKELKVRKLEPWNSVRVTLSIPREAALRLRQLANEGSQQLRALGILSVQVEGDQVISLRLAGPVSSEPQEIILRTAQDGGNSSTSAAADLGLSRLLSGATQPAETSVPSEKVQFRSPNVVCPPDTIVPKVPVPSVSSSTTPPTTKAYPGPFPFASMNQAIHSRDSLSATSSYTSPPPPYPGKHPPVTLSSPLLVNLLQTDGAPSPAKSAPERENSVVSGGSSAFVQANGSNTVMTTVSSSGQGRVMPVTRPLPSVPPSFVQKTVSIPVVQTSALPLAQNNTTSTTSAPHPIVPTMNLNVQSNTSNKPLLPASLHNDSSQTKTCVTQPNLNSIISQSPMPLLNAAMKQSFVKSTVNVTQSNSQTSVIAKPQVMPSNANNFPATQSSVQSSSSLQQNTLMPSKNTPVRTQSSAALYRPCPPPYPVRDWEPLASSVPQLLELTPSLTDLKADELDHLLPSLEQELAGSPPEIPEVLTRTTGDKRNFLINPLTGELEPQSSSESEVDEPSDVFTGLASPSTMSDEDTNSTIRPDTTDQSDSETRSCHSDSGKLSRLKNTKSRERGRDSPGIKPEKIKLRLKLEKSEPVSPAYKVDLSFINAQPKKASSMPVAAAEELRVPPLHISLRGRNHVVINNKKKAKFNPDGTPVKLKVRKTQEHVKLKKSDSPKELTVSDHAVVSAHLGAIGDPIKTKSGVSEPKKVKKSKPICDQTLIVGNHLVGQEPTEPAKHKLAVYNSHYKEKLKERRGSDSELARSTKKYTENNGLLSGDKKRRLSQTELELELQPSILGSTNTGTIASLPTHKPRKEKIKTKESFKSKEINRNKSYSKNLVKQVALPTGEIDMEAKFKQRLLEETEKGVPRPPHRTEAALQVTETNRIEQNEKAVGLVQGLPDPPPLKDKPPEPDKCNTPDRKTDISDKQQARSPNSGAQGEDSGIESMDALSEKSPNQASQSPHADLPESVKSKTQVPDMLDIEAQLAKMEGLNGEDLNENKRNGQAKLEQCCGLTSALQDSLKQGTVSLTPHSTPSLKEPLPQVEVSLVPLKIKSKEENLEPLPVRVTPPLYTYSNPDKGRGSESPILSDSDSNPCPTLIKSTSLLEQLLIDIPDHQAPNLPSPAARSLRTRASSKMNSPELSSSVVSKQNRPVNAVPKRKRHESDSSSNSIEDIRNKKHRKGSENSTELVKSCVGIEAKVNMKKNNKVLEESSDSDEPLIEKVRKHNVNNTPKAKLKPASTGIAKSAPVNTRRSVRTIPALNTRSKGDKAQTDSETLRRKTRSAVSEGENKRRKDIK